jgi:hypothetical protein
MKGVIGLALAFALMLSTVPAIASDTFHAFSTLPAATRSTLAPLSEAQLAAVEGKYLVGNQEALVHIFHLVWGIVARASLEINRSTDHRQMINIQSVFQLQWDTGGGAQTNIVEVRQQ